MPSLLIVEAEPAICDLFRRTFETQGDVTVLTAASAVESVEIVNSFQPDVAVVDVALPDRSGLELLADLRQCDPKLPVVFITSGGTSATAIDAVKHGAFDYLLKPLNPLQVRELITRALEVRRLMNQPIAIREELEQAVETGDALVGRCEAMQEVYKSIGRVAPQNVTVLIRGESGSGKELIARAIYHHSNRSTAPFLVVNCAAIPETLLESELFGHEKGSFTGADRRRIGKFEQCNGGTLFLDEIGDMPLALQSKVLRLLQDQRFERVGGNETIQTDVRIIAATNRNLEQMVEADRFRQDLYYRLNVFSIESPPLRERMEDLPLLVRHFLARANDELNKDVKNASPEAMQLLLSYGWPGNIRELQSVLKQAVLKSSGPVLLQDFLPELVRRQSPAADVRTPAASQSSTVSTNIAAWEQLIDEHLVRGGGDIYSAAIALTEKLVITRVLRHTEGNQAQAARLLGITRSTLRSKIRDLGIVIGRVVEVED